MRFAEAFLIVALGVGLTGCARKAKVVSAAPAPVKPPPSAAPAPPPEPLSIPQTNVQLPAPQPLTPEAIATTQVPGETTPTPPPPTTRPSSGRTRPPPRPAEPPPATLAPATPPVIEGGRAPITEVLPAAEQKRLQEEAATRSTEARKLIEQIPARRRQQDGRVRRIEAFLKQAADAERRGDMRQASELAGRALVLARELKP
jgi:hypothetical protein